MADTNMRSIRSIDELRQRRERDGGTLDRMTVMRLAIPQAVYDKYPEFDFRWINDVDNRMYVKTEVDTWQKVPDIDPIPVDVRNNQPVKAFLCMKPKEFIEQDRRFKEESIRKTEEGILGGGKQSDDLAGASYVPEGNFIQRGGRKITA